jgi:hypothetical protein
MKRKINIGRFHKFFEFFSNDITNKVIVNKEYGRDMHGVKAIALHSNGYAKSFFHVYFSVEKDRVLWEPGCECNIFVLKGKGILKLDENTYKIEKNEHYHISSGKYKKIFLENKEEESLDILFLGIRQSVV